MLKLLSFSSCLPNRVHIIVVSAIRTGSSDSTAPLLRVLNSLTGFTRKSPNLGPRAFFCSNSSDGSEQVVEISVKGCDSDAESKSSSAIVPMNPRPEDYPTVLALPLPHRPLFPGFYMRIYVKDPKLLAALRESRKWQATYAGAFLLKDEPGTDPSLVSGSETEKNIYDLKGKELFNRLHEVGTLARISSIQGDQVVLIGHRRLRITEMVSEDILTVKVDHLKDKPGDDVIKPMSLEVISTLRDVLKTSSLWRDHVQKYTQELGSEINDSGITVFSVPVLTSPMSNSFSIPLAIELIEKQHWSDLKAHVDDSSAATLLHQLFNSEADPEFILRYFNWSQKEFNVTHTLELSCRLLHSLANVKKYSKIRSFLDGFVKKTEKHSNSSIFHMLSMSSNRVCSNSIIIDMLLLAYVQNSKIQLAIEAFDRAGDYGFKLSALSCNPLLCALVKENRVGDVEYVYKEMIKRRIHMNLFTFNIVINGLCKVGKLNKAKGVIEDLKVWDLSPNVVTYNTLIDGYCKMGRTGKMYKADAILKEMVESKICPNVVTYNILIDGFCKDENVSAALKLLKEMQKQGLKPNVITYNSLINGLCNCGKLNEACCLRDEMLSLDLKPNVVTYNALINGFCKKKMINEATELIDEVRNQGLAPNVITYNILIDSYCKDRMMEKAFELLELMLERRVSHDASTYNCLIAGLCREGNMETARKLLEEMQDNGLKADLITYNILVDALCRKGESRKATRLLNEMLKMGLSPSHLTYNTLMDGYCREGNLRAALNVRAQMEKEGKRANIVTYNVLINGYSKKGKLDEANKLLNELLERGLIPSRTTYEIVREEMMEKGFIPDIEGHLYNVSGSS